MDLASMAQGTRGNANNPVHKEYNLRSKVRAAENPSTCRNGQQPVAQKHHVYAPTMQSEAARKASSHADVRAGTDGSGSTSPVMDSGSGEQQSHSERIKVPCPSCLLFATLGIRVRQRGVSSE